MVKAKESTWFVHINEGFAVEVKAINPEGAIMAAFAKYWEQTHSSGTLSFDIQVVNKTEYEHLQANGGEGNGKAAAGDKGKTTHS